MFGQFANLVLKMENTKTPPASDRGDRLMQYVHAFESGVWWLLWNLWCKSKIILSISIGRFDIKSNASHDEAYGCLIMCVVFFHCHACEVFLLFAFFFLINDKAICSGSRSLATHNWQAINAILCVTHFDALFWLRRHWLYTFFFFSTFPKGEALCLLSCTVCISYVIYFYDLRKSNSLNILRVIISHLFDLS